MARRIVLFVTLLAVSGCYAARVETGLAPSTTQIKKGFASCWIYGLVPPATVKTAAQCENGVAIVETKLSFVNGLVGALTFGIYTPMEIVVTCAQKPQASLMGAEVNLALCEGATTEEIQETFSHAADEAVRTGRPVIVSTSP